jgi:tetratricopeptide (TPR) repeat protein
VHLGNIRGDRLAYETAVDWFQRSLDLDPAFARAYLERGVIFWRELDHPRKAIHELNKALEQNPNLHEARFNRAIAHQQLGEYRRAVREFKSYLERGEHPHWREYARKMVTELREESECP